jgi:hypothetical protein
MIPLSLLMVIAGSPQSIYMFTSGALTTNAADPFAMFAMMQSGGYWLATLVGLVATMLTWSAAYLKIGAIGAGGDLGIGPALAKALTRLPVVLIMVILFGIALVIGTILLIIPAIILMVSLGLCFNTALFEEKGPVDALSESHRLVWGNWWRTAAILTVGFLIIFVIYLIAGMIIGVITPLVVLGGGTDNVLLISLVSGLLVGVLMSLLVTPFYISLAIAIYWDLKLRKDGGDLAARVGALNAA